MKTKEDFFVINDYILDNFIPIQQRGFIRDTCGMQDQDVSYYVKNGTTKQAERMGYYKFDTAIPIEYVNDCKSKIGQNPVGHIIWSYDFNRFGEPRGITRTGIMMVEIMKNLMENSHD